MTKTSPGSLTLWSFWATQRRVYLPRNSNGWWDFHAGRWHPGGQWLDLAVTLESIPLFVRGGAVLPLARGAMRATPQAEAARELALFPAPDEGTHQSFIYDDAGDNADALAGNHCLTTLTLSRTNGQLALDIKHEGAWPFPFADLTLALPATAQEALLYRGRRVGHGDMVPMESRA